MTFSCAFFQFSVCSRISSLPSPSAKVFYQGTTQSEGFHNCPTTLRCQCVFYHNCESQTWSSTAPCEKNPILNKCTQCVSTLAGLNSSELLPTLLIYACCKHTQSPEITSLSPGEYFLLSLAVQSSLLQMSYEAQTNKSRRLLQTLHNSMSGWKVDPRSRCPPGNCISLQSIAILKSTTQTSPLQRKVVCKYHLPRAERGSLWMKFEPSG